MARFSAEYLPEAHAGAILTIDLDAIAANWRLLRGKLASADCAAVVKADGYGLGAAEVAARLFAEGCGHFFVAQLEEGLALRRTLASAEIYVFNGPVAGSAPVFAAYGLIPVLNSLGQIEMWSALAAERGAALAGIVHLDTGMARLGLPAAEIDTLAAEPDRLDGIEIRYVMSHLVNAEDPDAPINGEQIARFGAIRGRLPSARASLANSSGIFLGPDAHFDLARPGAALYGVAPVSGAPNPMAQVLRLEGRILQLRDVDSPQTVGYGATHKIAGPARIATVALGYADGYLRHLSNCGACYVGDIRVPVVGRVSMDLITLDVTEVAPGRLEPGALVEVLGARITIDDAAAAAGTIGYEILTSLGRRYHRRYLGN